MKKTLRKIFTCLSASVTLLTASVSAMPASAIIQLTHYDINNKSYISRINKMERYIELEEEFVETAEYLSGQNIKLKHVYFRSRNHTSISCYFEKEKVKTGGRYFDEGYIAFDNVYYSKYGGDETAFFETYSLDELNKTLQEKELKVQLSKNIRSNGTTEIKATYDEDITEEELVRAAIELIKLCDLKFFHCILVSASNEIYYDESEQTSTEETTPSTSLGTQTIAGDLDLNDSVGASDIVMMSKYLASAQVYPIDDPTALANADVNQDGEINSDDTATMIEMYLGAYEMI